MIMDFWVIFFWNLCGMCGGIIDFIKESFLMFVIIILLINMRRKIVLGIVFIFFLGEIVDSCGLMGIFLIIKFDVK